MPSTRTIPRFVNPRQELPFIYKSYFRLADDLGRMDALGSAIALSTRYFEAAAAAAPDMQQFAIGEARRFNIPTRWVSFNDLPPHTAQLLLVGVYQQAEGFLVDIKKEIRLLGRQWRDFIDGESRLRYTLDCLKHVTLNQTIRDVGEERYHLFEYYRILRNRFVHLHIERAKLTREYQRVAGYRADVLAEFGLNAPNPFEQLTYDDFLLFTRLTKYFASDICYLATPTDAELLSLLIALEGEEDERPLSFLRRSCGSRSGAQKAIRGWYAANYRFDLSARVVAENEILDHIMEMPNRKERRRMAKVD